MKSMKNLSLTVFFIHVNVHFQISVVVEGIIVIIVVKVSDV